MLHLVCFVLLASSLAYGDGDHYTAEFDGVDLEEIVKSDRLLNNYVNCLMEKGPCTPDGTELKQNLPDALQSECKKCTEKQKEGSSFIMQFLIDNKPEMWQQLEEKYDPSGNYKKTYIESKHEK